jgi:hypothetical protein
VIVEMTPITFEGAAFVAANMRDCDRAEIYATRWNDDPEELARTAVAVPDFSWLFWVDGVPASVIGAIPCHPGLWSVFAFGTPDWRSAALAMSRHVRGVMIPGLMRAGALRAECRSISTHTEAHAWLRMLGAQHEGTLESYGKNGEDFYVFRWKRDDVHRRRWRR